MHDISIIIISKEDQDVIGNAIQSVKDLGQIVVIDSNNNDLTSNLCKKMGVKTIKHPFKDFSDQRNFGIANVTTKWVLYLDSDEVVTPAFKKEVIEIISTHSSSDPSAYFIKRKTFYYGKDWHFEDKMQRLFLRNDFIEWKGVVHETPHVKGEWGELVNPIEHYTHRNISQMVVKTNEWSEYEARLRLNANHPSLVPWRFFRVMLTAFTDSYIKNKGYKNGTYGFIEGIYQSFSMFITYAKLWELQQKKN